MLEATQPVVTRQSEAHAMGLNGKKGMWMPGAEGSYHNPLDNPPRSCTRKVRPASITRFWIPVTKEKNEQDAVHLNYIIVEMLIKL